MKKGLIGLLAGIACLGCLTACNRGIEKEYKLDVKESYTAYITSEVQEKTEDVFVVHCKKTLSSFNYYIEVPELPKKLPEKLIAKDTGKKITYHIEIDGKDKKVSNHGYEFVKWIEK